MSGTSSVKWGDRTAIFFYAVRVLRKGGKNVKRERGKGGERYKQLEGKKRMAL